MPGTEAFPPPPPPASVDRPSPRHTVPAPLLPCRGGTPGWLGPVFGLAAAAPKAMRVLRPLVCRVAPAVSSQVRVSTRLNARRIHGRALAPAEQRRFTRDVVGYFYDFVCDVGEAASPPLLSGGKIHRVEGLDGYLAARASRRGAILITAHLGSFEAGLAALAAAEGPPTRIRVIFQRDASAAFDRLRSRLRRRLGIIESPIDEGWSSWLPLREALLNDEVIVMQGDRAVPGQRSLSIPFLHGHLRIPTGPVRLARLTRSPIIPVFAPRVNRRQYAVLLGTPIEPSPPCTTGDADLLAVGQAIQSIVARYPEQWLALQPVFEEDAPHAS